MATELERIIRNEDSPNASIDLSLLQKHTVMKSRNSIPGSWRKKPRLTQLHILGSSAKLALNGQNEWYMDPQGRWMLILNPPENFGLEDIPLPLGNLRVLDLRFSGFTRLELEAMPELEQLTISHNSALKSVTGWERLHALKELDIRNTQLDDPDSITHCSALQKLNAGGLVLEDARFLARLTALSELNLSQSRITLFPDLKVLTALKSLDLSNAMLPDVIEAGFPESLEILSLAYSSLHWLPEGLRELTKLQFLDLSGLQLAQLPNWLADLGMGFHTEGSIGILLKDTKFEDIDMSIFKRDPETIRQWFLERKEADRLVPVNEVKVVFLGDGGVGKSLLIKRLMNYDVLPEGLADDSATNGISIYNRVYDLNGREVTLHFWDFGGQEVLHAIHRMFLTDHTIYVLMVDARAGSPMDRGEYWLNTLRELSVNSPVMLVLNKIDQNPGVSIDERTLRSRYPNLKDIAYISARYSTPDDFRTSFTYVLLNLIEEQSMFNTMLPASWQQLRRRLNLISEPYISRAQFERFCDEANVPAGQETRGSLLSWFHDMGICFSYQSSLRLENRIIINPAWITNAIYRIIWDVQGNASNGVVAHSELFRLLALRGRQWDAFNDIIYTREDAEYILDVMRKFQISFQFSDSEEFIPAVGRDYAPYIFANYQQDPSVALFRLEYEYQPLNLLHRLMVELRHNLDPDAVWRLGAQFIWKDQHTRALVECSGNFLNIGIETEDRTENAIRYLDIFRDTLEQIQQDMRMPAGRLMVAYRQDRETEWFDYKMLVAMVKNGAEQIRSNLFGGIVRISDILGNTEHLQAQEKQRLAVSIASICKQVQNGRSLWDAEENAYAGYMRNALVDQGYVVWDQTVAGVSAHGGEIGLEIRLSSAQDRLWALCELMTIRGNAPEERLLWNRHLENLLLGCNDANGVLLFTISYATCSIEQYPAVWDEFGSHIRSHAPKGYHLQRADSDPLGTDRDLLNCVRCIYDHAGGSVVAYHFFVRVGFDQVMEKKHEQRRQADTAEYKVVFLGDGEAGKTLTVARLCDPLVDPISVNGDVTPGIKITDKVYEVKGQHVRVNFWDFGGQEILHSMHRLFLTERTLYIVVLNTRNDTQEERARFWLRYIHTYAPKASVFLVLNKIDQNEYASINHTALNRVHAVEKVLRLSALKYSQEDFKADFLDPLTEHIQSICVEESSFIENECPVRDKLRSWARPRITVKDYYQLCEDAEIRDPEKQNALLKKLEETGICVHFQGDSYTEEYRLMDPNWITNAIYIILFNLHSQARSGVISHAEIREIFADEKRNIKCIYKIHYEAEEVEFILKVMRSYRLSFEIPDQQQEFLPMLCPRMEAPELKGFLEDKNRLEFHVCFDYLPAEVLYKFMVARQNELDLEQGSIWLNGAFMTDREGCQAAVIKEDNILKFHISRSKGLPHARSYMDSLRHDLELILQKHSINPPEYRVVYRYGEFEEVFDYKRLKLAAQHGIQETVSIALGKPVAIRDIMDQTYRSEELQYSALIKHLVLACSILQDNFDYWGKTENVLNRGIRDLLRAMGYGVMDQPEFGASAKWKGSGKPDMVVSFKDSPSNVLIEALRVKGTNETDTDDWKKHLNRMSENYNCSGFRTMILLTYALCSIQNFEKIDKHYYDEMCAHHPSGNTGSPEWCVRETEIEKEVLKMENRQERSFIRITRADYYNKGYSPTIYHFLVRIPLKSECPDLNGEDPDSENQD